MSMMRPTSMLAAAIFSWLHWNSGMIFAVWADVK